MVFAKLDETREFAHEAHVAGRTPPDALAVRLEVNKKLTETLRLSLRHEYRRTSPDIRVTDCAFWQFLVGFDF